MCERQWHFLRLEFFSRPATTLARILRNTLEGKRGFFGNGSSNNTSGPYHHMMTTDDDDDGGADDGDDDGTERRPFAFRVLQGSVK